jgi:acyl-CoA synthetase (NDP forming)
VRMLEEEGIPVLEGTLTGLAAVKHLFARRDPRSLSPIGGSSPVADEVRERWRARLSSGQALDEVDGLELLEAYGVPVVRAERAGSVDRAVASANRIGFPVALKTAEPEIPHKSDVGGVHLGLTDAAAVEAAYRDLGERLGARVIVAGMASAGVEMHLGIVRDLQFGPLVLVAAGGVLVEVLRDRRLALPPLDESRARRLLDRLSVRALLGGVRGAPAADVEGLIRAVVGLSWLAHDLGDRLDALDANPVICAPTGCVAVDALVIPRAG